MSATWEEKWMAQTDGIRSDITYTQSADILRELIRTGLLRFTDIGADPEKFFKAHRLLTDPGKRGPGFGIRFTVQYNLFAGSVVGLGGPEQVKLLDEMQEKGQLGCFGLTERLAGVNSGLVVNTTAEWLPDKQMFKLHCPTEGSIKNWISQGLTADKCVATASLIVEGKNYGPHAFLMDLRQNGVVVPGVVLGDMGRKTTGNDLDNAWIKFENVLLPKSALLNRYADIRDNKYVQTTAERMRIEIIGARLLSGRVAIAQSALVFARGLFNLTKKYSDKKLCWAPGAHPSLTEVPQLNALYIEGFGALDRLDRFVSAIEKKLNHILSTGGVASVELVEAIAVAKVKAVETAIEYCHKLKQEVGSYALMGDTGFEHSDFLVCCKFAEGDSRIMMQKMARDRMKRFADDMKAGKKMETTEEAKLCMVLAKGGAKKWNENWRSVYGLAEVIMNRIMQTYCPDAKL